MRGTGRLFGATLLVVSVALSGCGLLEGRLNEPAAIRRDGAAIEVAVCADVRASLVVMEQRNLRDGVPWATFWEISTEFDISEGDVLSTSSEGTPAFADELRANPRMTPNDQIRIYIAHPAPEAPHPSVNSTFYIGEAGLSEEEWLHPDGTTTAEPCE